MNQHRVKSPPDRESPKDYFKSSREVLEMAWYFIRWVCIIAASVMLIMSAGVWAWNKFNTGYLQPVDTADNTPVVVEIRSGSSVATIARLLEENDVIRSKTAFKYYVDIMGYGSDLKAGTYILNRTMTMQEIIDKMAKGQAKATVMTFTAVEGLTIEQLAQVLVDQGALTSKDRFLELCKTGSTFTKYSAIAQVSGDDTGRRYVLEGYLFPAKYEIYKDSTEEEIIEKMLNKFTAVMSDQYLLRADEIGMTVDQVITLASMIEREAKTDDFAKVSAVFHNRLKAEMPLQSCATVQYVLGVRKLNLTDADIATDSPYNTYLYSGLPVGPICCPSEKAIIAALYPDEEYVSEGYLYFCTKDPLSGELEFSKTQAEHDAAVEQYRPLWQAYDEQYANQ